MRKKLDLRYQQARRFTTTTDSKHRLPMAENRVSQTFVATQPNETWVIGHAMGARMTTDLASRALVMAVGAKRLGLIHHFDRGA